MIAEALAALTAAAEGARRLGPWGCGLGVAGGIALIAVAARFRTTLAVSGGGLVGALLGAAVPLAGRAALGAAAGALVGGFIGFIAAREVSAVFASAAAGLLAALGLVGMSGTRPLGREIAAHPAALLAVALVIAIAAAAYQLSRPDAPRHRPTVPRTPGPPTLPDRGERGYP